MNFDFEFCERKRRLLVSGHLNFLKDEWKLGKWEQGGALCRFNRKSKFKFKVGFGICFEFKFCIFLELTSHGRFNVYHSVHKAAGYMVYVE